MKGIYRNADTGAGSGGEDNSVIRSLREEIRKRDEALREAEGLKSKAAESEQLRAKLTEIERAKLDEIDRLKAEREDLLGFKTKAEALQGETAKYETAFRNLYDAEMASLPESAREKVAKLSSTGSYAERLDALRTAKDLIVPAVIRSAGTVTQPAQPGSVSHVAEPKASMPPSQWGGISLRDSLVSPETTTVKALDGTTITGVKPQ